MKKSLSAIIIAAFVALSVICAFAVQAEEPSVGVSGEVEPNEAAVVYNFLAALTDTDGSYYTVKTNANGSVTVTLKQEATQEAPIMLATYSDAKIDLSGPAYFAADFRTENTDMDFRLNYTRKDYEGTEKNGIANLYFTGMKKADEYTKSSTDTSIVWDFAAYVSGAKRYENNIHEFKDLAITAGNAGDSITFNTLAIVSDETAMVVGIPLVSPTPDDTTSDETSTEETTSEEITSDETDPEETTSDETAPEETTSDETAPETTSDETDPEETTSEEITSDETAPETTSDETDPEETTSDETLPEETSSVENTSDETTPAETTSPEETSSVEETSSMETSSVENTSDETSPEATSSEATSSTGPVSSGSDSTPSSPNTGDAGVILYVVLAVLAAAGAIAMVRLRKE